MFRILVVVTLLFGTICAGIFLTQKSTFAGTETISENAGTGGDYGAVAELMEHIAALEARLSAAETELLILRGQLVALRDDNLLTLIQSPAPGTLVIPRSGGTVIAPPANIPTIQLAPQLGPIVPPGDIPIRPLINSPLPTMDAVMSIVGGTINGLRGPHLIIEGVNVHIRSGSGSTSESVGLTGLGNLIVGYNEPDDVSNPDDRVGSHNLVVGKWHKYRSVGGFVAGLENTISAQYASVSGGRDNTASGRASSVTGGTFSSATGDGASISGGFENVASGLTASVSGGNNNVASGSRAAVSGGSFNLAEGDVSSVSGGYQGVVGSTFEWRAGGLSQQQ